MAFVMHAILYLVVLAFSLKILSDVASTLSPSEMLVIFLIVIFFLTATYVNTNTKDLHFQFDKIHLYTTVSCDCGVNTPFRVGA